MVAKHYLDADELVPSEVTNALVEARINQSDAAHGFILDGYPSLAQAEALTHMPAVRDQSIDTVLQFQVCEATLLTRITDRVRADDIDEVIQSRFKGHREQTEPLSHYHRNEVITIDGFGSIDEVFTPVLPALGR